MRTFIQLRDGIGFATITTAGEVDHSVTPEHTTAIEVFTDNPDQFLKKLYNFDTQSWTDAPLYRYAELNENGNIIEVRRTPFLPEIPSNAVLMAENVDFTWRYLDGEWVAPVVEIDLVPQNELESPATNQERNPNNEVISSEEKQV